MEKIKIIDDWLDSAQLICTKADVKTKNDFNFMFPSKFFLKFFCRDLTLQKPKHDQKKLKILINRLNNDYNPKNLEKIKENDETLNSAKKLFFIREEIIRTFKKSIFPYIDGFQEEKKSDEESDEESDEDTLEAVNTTDKPDLESEESATQRRNQLGQGLKY